VELANAAITAFAPRCHALWLAGMREKLGLSGEAEGDLDLVGGLLEAMHANGADFTLTFRRLCAAAEDPAADAGARALFADPAACDRWAETWRARLGADRRDPRARAAAMRAVNPAFIPRNHRVEHALDAAIETGDFAPFETLLTVLARPYEEQAEFAEYAEPAPPSERVLRTFCGT